MDCPICGERLEDQDEAYVCSGGCGAEYGLHYLGAYEEEGSSERTDDGFETQAWLDKWGKAKGEAKSELKFV